jgi:hypothetical protein
MAQRGEVITHGGGKWKPQGVCEGMKSNKKAFSPLLFLDKTQM